MNIWWTFAYMEGDITYLPKGATVWNFIGLTLVD